MKKYIFGGMLFLMTACSSSVQENPNVAIAKKLFEAFNQHDWKTMAELYAENALFLDPSFGKAFVPKSRAETIAKYTEMQIMFPDIHDEVKNLYPSGETIAVEFTSTGTAPDGTNFSLPIVSILTVKDGLIVKDATYYDL